MKNYTTPNYYQLGEWIDAWQEPLYRYAFFRLGRRDEAEDVVQDAFLKIASSSIQIKNPKAYLFRMVANGCVDTLRRRGRNISLASQTATPAESYDTEAEEGAIKELAHKLIMDMGELLDDIDWRITHEIHRVQV